MLNVNIRTTGAVLALRLWSVRARFLPASLAAGLAVEARPHDPVAPVGLADNPAVLAPQGHLVSHLGRGDFPSTRAEDLELARSL